MLRSLTPLTIALALLGTQQTASAAVTVNFGGDMVASSVSFQTEIDTAQTETGLDQDFNGDGIKDSSRVIYRALDLSTPWLATSASYTGPSFYGGMSAWTASTTGGSFQMDASSVINNAAGDYLRPIFRTGTSSDSRAAAFVMLFAVADPGSGQFTQFSAGDSLSHAQGATGVFSNTHRFVVRAGGQFYLSETVGATLGTVDPSAINWAAYGIEDGDKNLLVPGSTGVSGSLNFNTLGSTLSEIDFVGVIGINTSSSGTASSAPSIGSFTASISVIPEPGSLALLGLGALMLLPRRRNPA